MLVSEKIIVTFTSFPGRINNVAKLVYSILRNTRKPDLIVCNLSKEEFPNGILDLPHDMRLMIKGGYFEVHFVDKNTRQFKKLIPTLDRFPNDVVISIDDDVIYPENFIESMYNDYLKYDKKYPITGGHWIDRGYYQNKPSHHGSFTLITKSMFGRNFTKVKKLIRNELWEKIWFDDPLYTYAVMGNGLEYKMSSYNWSRYKRGFVSKGVSDSNRDKRYFEHKYLKEVFRCK